MKEEISVMYSEEVLNKKIGEMAEQISKDYEGNTVADALIGYPFAQPYQELAKRLTVPVTIDFMSASSYGNETKSTGKLKINKDLDEEIDGLHCLIVEDIIDSGNTLSMTKKMLEGRNPASLKLCTLLDKPDRRETEVNVDYTGFTIPDAFVVGFGLDYAQKYRNLPYIGILDFVEE